MRLRLWISFCLIFALAGLALFASSCGSSSHTQLRLLNANVLYPNLNLLVDGNTVQSNVAYATASAYSKVSSGTRHVQVEPGGGGTAIIDINPSIGSGTSNTLLAYLDSSNNLQNSLLVDDNSAPSSGNFKIRVINASPADPSADVFVVPSGTSLSGVNPTVTSLQAGGQDNGQASTYISLAAGDYDIYFTIPGTTVWYAQSLQVAFSAGQVRTAVFLNGNPGGPMIAVLSDAG